MLATGVTRDALEDAIVVAALFNMIVRLADGLGFDVPPYESFVVRAEAMLESGYALEDDYGEELGELRLDVAEPARLRIVGRARQRHCGAGRPGPLGIGAGRGDGVAQRSQVREVGLRDGERLRGGEQRAVAGRDVRRRIVHEDVDEPRERRPVLRGALDERELDRREMVAHCEQVQVPDAIRGAVGRVSAERGRLHREGADPVRDAGLQHAVGTRLSGDLEPVRRRPRADRRRRLAGRDELCCPFAHRRHGGGKRGDAADVIPVGVGREHVRHPCAEPRCPRRDLRHLGRRDARVDRHRHIAGDEQQRRRLPERALEALEQHQRRGNGLRASAGSTCDVTQTGVAA